MSLLLLTFTAASAAPRECWTVKPVTGRVRDNVGHQGEELVYRLVAAGLRQAPPRAVYWPWPILPWSREVLEATLPDVEVASGDGAEAPKACLKGEKTWRPEYKRPQWPSIKIHAQARASARTGTATSTTRRGGRSSCGSCSGATPRSRRRRKRRTEVCGGGGIKRNLRDVDELKATIAAARAAGVGLVFETDYVENANPGGFCDQLRRFASADVLVSVHGAHLVNAPWIAPGGLLLEALPYGHKRSTRNTTRASAENTRASSEHGASAACGPRRRFPKRNPSARAAPPRRESARWWRATATRRRSGPEAKDARRRPCECLDVLEKRLTGFLRGGGSLVVVHGGAVLRRWGGGRRRAALGLVKFTHIRRRLSAMIARPVFGGGDDIGGSATPSSSDASDAVSSSSSSDAAAASHLES